MTSMAGARTGALARHSSPRARVSRTIGRGLIVAALVIYGVLSVFPFLVMVSGALKSSVEVLTNPWPVPLEPTLKTLSDTLAVLDIPSLLWNSIILTGGTCLLILLIYPLASYAFAVLQFPFKRAIFAVFVVAIFVPGVTTLLPTILLDQWLGLMNSPLAVILPVANGAAPIAILLLRSYYASMPTELHDAAVMDGCSEFGVFRRVYFPLSRPALITVTVLSFIAEWNDYVLPSLTQDDPSRFPLPVGLQSLLSVSLVQWNQVMAGALIVVIPVIAMFIVLQRYFISGLSGAVKG